MAGKTGAESWGSASEDLCALTAVTVRPSGRDGAQL